MKANPLVSVVIPVFNREKCIRRCLLSFAGQTYKNLEIIVVDHSSTDSTPEIIEDIVKSSRIMRYYVVPRAARKEILSPMCVAPRRFGGAIAKGDLIIQSSSHIIAPKNHIEILVEEFLKLDDDVVCISCRDRFCGGDIFKIFPYCLWYLVRRFPKKSGFSEIIIWAAFKRSFLEKFFGKEKWPKGDDAELARATSGMKKYFTTKTYVYHMAVRSVLEFFNHMICYGRGRALLCKRFEPEKTARYARLALITFFSGYGVGFFLGLLGVNGGGLGYEKVVQ